MSTNHSYSARSLSASPNRGAQDLALRRRRSVSAQDRPSPPVRAEESPVPLVNAMPLQIDPSVPQTRKRRISGIENTRGASPYRAVESVPERTNINPVRHIASPVKPIALESPRERILPDDAARTGTLDKQEPVDSATRVRKRTSISAIVTSVPSREESRTTTTASSDRAVEKNVDAKEGKLTWIATICLLLTKSLQQLRQ